MFDNAAKIKEVTPPETYRHSHGPYDSNEFGSAKSRLTNESHVSDMNRDNRFVRTTNRDTSLPHDDTVRRKQVQAIVTMSHGNVNQIGIKETRHKGYSVNSDLIDDHDGDDDEASWRSMRSLAKNNI